MCLLDGVHPRGCGGAVDEQLFWSKPDDVSDACTRESEIDKSLGISASPSSVKVEQQEFSRTASCSPILFPPTFASLNSRCCNACVALTQPQPTPIVHASSNFTRFGTRKHIPGSATRNSAKPPVWLSLHPWTTPAMRSSLRKEEDLGSATVPEKSQPITFEGGRDMEACLSGGRFC